MRKLVIAAEESGQRLDKFLGKYLNQAPKSFLYKMLRKKNIKLNGKKAEGNEILQPLDEVDIYLAEDTVSKFRVITIVDGVSYHDICVVYENQHVVFMNKPMGVLSQKAKVDDISMVEQFISYLNQTNQLSLESQRAFSPSICNRLDRNTTGLIIGGKSLFGLQMMGKLIKEHTLEKYYLCIVFGKMEQGKRIEGYLKKNEQQNQVVITKEPCEGADPIVTAYEPVYSNNQYTLLKVNLITGKTHQIRAHLASIGHGIIGDEKYGNRKINKELKDRFGLSHQLLHSYEMVFPESVEEFPDLVGQTIRASLPAEFCDIFKGLFKDKGVDGCGNMEFQRASGLVFGRDD